MKKLILIFSAFLLALFATGMLREQTHAVRVKTAALRGQEISVTNELVVFENARLEARQAIAQQKTQRRASSQPLLLNSALADWLLATNHANVPRNLVPVLREALGLPWNDSSDYVLVSKATLNDLQMTTINRDDKLSKTLCAVLDIGPEAQRQIESALSQTRREYVDWAKTNLLREGPSGDTLFTYKIPASPEQAQRWTNTLFSVFQNAVGTEREGLLEKHAADWIRFELGYLGAAETRFKVFRRNENGTSILNYSLTRDNGSGESGRITPDHLHPTFQKIFPGGWPEIAQREGFELPATSLPKPTGLSRQVLVPVRVRE